MENWNIENGLHGILLGDAVRLHTVETLDRSIVDVGNAVRQTRRVVREPHGELWGASTC